MESSPGVPTYEHADSDCPCMAMASKRGLGGGVPGTPEDISTNGCVEVGR